MGGGIGIFIDSKRTYDRHLDHCPMSSRIQFNSIFFFYEGNKISD